MGERINRKTWQVMRFVIAILVGASLLSPAPASGQELSAWGRTFSCGVDWFKPCEPKKPETARQKEVKPAAKPKKEETAAVSLVAGPNQANMPGPVREVLQNPSPESAKRYVEWLREGNERIAEASDYIAQAEREIGPPKGKLGQRIEERKQIESMGVVGLYYFFSPYDETGKSDVGALNKLFRDDQLGVVGIPVGGREEEVARWAAFTKPLFPVRKGTEEVKLLSPKGTPDLYLALPLRKKIYHVGNIVTGAAVKQALANAVAEEVKERFGARGR